MFKSEPRFTGQLRSLWDSLANGGVLAGRTTEGRRLTIRKPPTWLFWALLATAVVVAGAYEIKTSALQSRIFSYASQRMTYEVGPGPSSSITFPTSGPFDTRRGYARIPEFQQRLENQGFRVSEQSRFSPFLNRLVQWGITPPYRETEAGGLLIRSAEGRVIHDATDAGVYLRSYDEIPPVVVNALLLIENRQLSAQSYPTNNPVVEWNRLIKASFTYAGSRIGLPVRLEGGSTLATQLEKYLHSPAGRTESGGDKLRQIVSASLKAYHNGPDTSEARRNIIADYLNSMPLAAAPGWGEVNGLGPGLRAWFGADLDETLETLRERENTPRKAVALKRVLTLLSAVKAPGYYLLGNRDSLEERTRYYTSLLTQSGLLDADFGRQVREAGVDFASQSSFDAATYGPRQKLSGAIRYHLASLLGVGDFYDLNRIDLKVRTAIDSDLQEQANTLLASLEDPDFLRRKGFLQERLLQSGDPRKVTYSVVLYESLPEGNVLRVQTDNLDKPLDINEGIKMELGSTAKLRTLAHYLEVVASLHGERQTLAVAEDPITAFVLAALQANPQLSLDELLQAALDRTYSASPAEVFFTAGGAHTFGNFDAGDNGRRLTVREATRRSTNLVFIRLMRDLVRYHQARLPYKPAQVLSDVTNPTRLRLLREAADSESELFLSRAFRRFRETDKREIVSQLLGKRAASPRHLAILFFAWRGAVHEDVNESLATWLDSLGVHADADQVARLAKAYGNPRLTLADYGYLLSRHPLDVWVAGRMFDNPHMKWQELWAQSGSARELSSAWLFRPKNRRAQDLRLRIRIEQDAFARMTPYWRRLGFPFEQLVPSLATAIGNSSDRPAALAELMGIILNDGELRPIRRFEELQFADRTPYRTVAIPADQPSRQVMIPAVARALKDVLAEVVDEGTARRASGVFKTRDGTKIIVGGKTGSGDNRHKSFSHGGGVVASRPVNRTATFAFYIGNRYFGVVTASVVGPEAGDYRFTSALPVEILKSLAPAIVERYTLPTGTASRSAEGDQLATGASAPWIRDHSIGDESHGFQPPGRGPEVRRTDTFIENQAA